MGKSYRVKKTERGYLIIFMLFALLVVTVAISIALQIVYMNRSYELLQYSNELAAQGFYITTQPYAVDMSVFNWVISAESAAIAVVVPFQFKKKQRNNTDEYMQKWIDSMKNDPILQPQMPQIIMAYLQTNSSN